METLQVPIRLGADLLRRKPPWLHDWLVHSRVLRACFRCVLGWAGFRTAPGGRELLIADDAKLWLRAEKRYVTKPEWLKEIQRQFSAKRVLGAEWKDTWVKMVDPTHSVVETKIVVDYTRPTGTPPLSYDAEYKLEQRDGKWLIVEALAKN